MNRIEPKSICRIFASPKIACPLILFERMTSTIENIIYEKLTIAQKREVRLDV